MVIKMTESLKNKLFRRLSEREDRSLLEFACRSSNGQRRRAENNSDFGTIVRTSFFRDTDRIIHSSAYARYIDKTQVFYLFENDHLTHRVLHVQFVSKIGRVIARALGLNEDLVESIALGHDLGHVPYGHDGETVLNNICRKHKIGSFAHNVQSVRALDVIENNGTGLNLTLQTLDGILAHNGEMISREYRPDFSKDWQQFEYEYKQCLSDKEKCRKLQPMTLEGCVVRISDVIAYIGRDIEDALRVRVIRPRDIPAKVTSTLGKHNNQIINTLVTDLIANSFDKPYLAFSRKVFSALCDLKEFNYKNIYFSPAIKTQDTKIVNIFNVLFDKYLNDLKEDDQESHIVKYFVKSKSDSYVKNTHPARVVADFIAGMTDDYFNNQFKELFVPKSFGYSLSSNI